MSKVTDDEIYDEMTTAFTRQCTRSLTDKAKHGLREFIRVSVINGHHRDPKLYPLCREYLKCRFETIGAFLSVGTGDVTWTQLIDRGSAEVGLECNSPCVAFLSSEYRQYCLEMAERRKKVDDSDPDSGAALISRALQLCVGYRRQDLKDPPGGPD